MENATLKILLVEDDQVDQLAFKRLVKAQNLAYDYTLAGSVTAAQNYLASQKFDVVIADYNLGDGNAFDLFASIGDTPVIFATGLGDEAVAVKAMKAGAVDYLIKDVERNYLKILPATIDKAIKRKQLERDLRQRDLLLAGLAAAESRLLTVTNYTTAINMALAIIGQAAAVDRVYIFENHSEPDTGKPVCTQRFEWVKDGVQPQKDNPALQNCLWSDPGLTRWHTLLTGKEIINGPIRSFPAPEQELLLPRGVHSLLIVPIFIGQYFWGFIGFDDYQTERRWSKNEEVILMALAASIGGALQRQQTEEELRQRTDELQTHNEELDAFAHTVAHDLQSPLSPIVGFASILKNEYTTLSTAEIEEFADRIIRNGNKMSDIIRELLLLAQIRKTDIRPEPLNMAFIVGETLQRLTSMTEEYQAEITLPEYWPVALGYGPWIEEVWANYISNAMKYGGRPPHLELGATVENSADFTLPAVRFWVRDNGPGLTPDEQAKLFAQFTRLHQVRAKGQGLGLSIVRRIINKLDGRTGVESQVGQGSVFSFTLPAG